MVMMGWYERVVDSERREGCWCKKERVLEVDEKVVDKGGDGKGNEDNADGGCWLGCEFDVIDVSLWLSMKKTWKESKIRFVKGSYR